MACVSWSSSTQRIRFLGAATDAIAVISTSQVVQMFFKLTYQGWVGNPNKPIDRDTTPITYSVLFNIEQLWRYSFASESAAREFEKAINREGRLPAAWTTERS